MVATGVVTRQKRVFRVRHPWWKVARAVLLLAAIPFFKPEIVNLFVSQTVLPEAATRFLSGALLLAPLGTAIEWAMEHVTEHLYHFHTRLGMRKRKFETRDKLEQYAAMRAQFMGGFIHSLATNLAYLVLSGTVLYSAASAGEETKKELIGVVLSSIAGNLVVNILLVLGIATIIGGLLHKGIAYDKDIANAYAEMLTLAVIALGLPTLAYRLHLSLGLGDQAFDLSSNEAGPLSIITAIILFAVFVGYFLYTVVGFRASEISESNAQTSGPRPSGTQGAQADGQRGIRLPSLSEESGTAEASADPQRAPRRGLLPMLSVFLSRLPVLLFIVGISGTAIVVISEQMAGALEAGLKPGGFLVNKDTFLPGISLNAFFVGFILLPIATHIAEVFAAISMTTHVESVTIEADHAEGVNAEAGEASVGTIKTEPRLETCHGITVGASIQIALLVAPLLLLWGQFLGLSQMNLIFSPFILAIFGLMVFLLQVNVFDGKTDWLEGLEMVTFFVLLAVVAFLAVPGQ